MLSLGIRKYWKDSAPLSTCLHDVAFPVSSSQQFALAIIGGLAVHSIVSTCVCEQRTPKPQRIYFHQVPLVQHLSDFSTIQWATVGHIHKGLGLGFGNGCLFFDHSLCPRCSEISKNNSFCISLVHPSFLWSSVKYNNYEYETFPVKITVWFLSSALTLTEIELAPEKNSRCSSQKYDIVYCSGKSWLLIQFLELS